MPCMAWPKVVEGWRVIWVWVVPGWKPEWELLPIVQDNSSQPIHPCTWWEVCFPDSPGTLSYRAEFQAQWLGLT